jgi:adenosylcobinamide-phosphate synthase
LSRPFRILAEAVALKSTFAWRGLDQAASAIETDLRYGELEAARRHLSWHLVSRPTASLTAAEVAAATVESLAENTSDGIIAPLMAYLLGGLPAALAYRYANTADAMLGYHDPVHEWLGKMPARTDDLLNLLPARLTAVLLVLVAPWCGVDALHAWRIWRRDRHLTLSPNAGHPMSAMAGALQVELTKIGQYTLGRGEGVATPETIRQARRVVRGIMGFFLLGLLFLPERFMEHPHG